LVCRKWRLTSDLIKILEEQIEQDIVNSTNKDIGPGDFVASYVNINGKMGEGLQSLSQLFGCGVALPALAVDISTLDKTVPSALSLQILSSMQNDQMLEFLNSSITNNGPFRPMLSLGPFDESRLELQDWQWMIAQLRSRLQKTCRKWGIDIDS
jgi:hypothetical protein